MDFFKFNKYNSLDENVLIASKYIYEIVEDEMAIDEVFEEYSRRRSIALNLSLERILYLSLTFLFAVGKLEINYHRIKRC